MTMQSNSLICVTRLILATQRANTFDHYPVHRDALVCWQTVVIGTPGIEFSVFLSRVVTLLVLVCLSIGPFY